MIQVCSNSDRGVTWSWPIRGQYSDQSEASIPANQRLEDVTKWADGGKLLCIKKRVLMELLFLSKYNFDHCIFCDLNKCSQVYWDLAQIEARHEEQEPKWQETEMRNKCAQRLVQRPISPGPRPLSMRPEVGKAFIENSKNANNTHIEPGVLHLGGVIHWKQGYLRGLRD